MPVHTYFLLVWKMYPYRTHMDFFHNTYSFLPHFKQRVNEPRQGEGHFQSHIFKQSQDPRISKSIQDSQEEIEAWVSASACAVSVIFNEQLLWAIIALDPGNVDKSRHWRPCLIKIYHFKAFPHVAQKPAPGFPGLF